MRTNKQVSLQASILIRDDTLGAGKLEEGGKSCMEVERERFITGPLSPPPPPRLLSCPSVHSVSCHVVQVTWSLSPSFARVALSRTCSLLFSPGISDPHYQTNVPDGPGNMDRIFVQNRGQGTFCWTLHRVSIGRSITIGYYQQQDFSSFITAHYFVTVAVVLLLYLRVLLNQIEQ